jgi:hypothetical protein
LVTLNYFNFEFIIFTSFFIIKQSPKRVVPPHIPRPDYADHELGHPLGEIAERGSTTVKVLDDEEIEGLKTACKVNFSSK